MKGSGVELRTFMNFLSSVYSSVLGTNNSYDVHLLLTVDKKVGLILYYCLDQWYSCVCWEYQVTYASVNME